MKMFVLKNIFLKGTGLGGARALSLDICVTTKEGIQITYKLQIQYNSQSHCEVLFCDLISGINAMKLIIPSFRAITSREKLVQ